VRVFVAARKLSNDAIIARAVACDRFLDEVYAPKSSRFCEGFIPAFFGKHPFHHLAGTRFYRRRTYFSVRNQSVTDIERQLSRAFYLNPNSSRIKSLTPSGPVRWSQTEPFCRSQRTSNPKNGQHCRSNSTHATNCAVLICLVSIWNA
jgi:hypothetical protein